jgi:DNA (cytosine-5)-methyltransferase 1
MTLKIAELFTGTGAFTYAFEEFEEFETVFSNDMEPNSKKIYDLNYDTSLTLSNIHNIKNEDIPKMDIITGGFPCQPFSIAGKKEGFNDERSNVFFKIISIINYHKPRFVILENVKNLLSHDDNKTFERISKEIKDIGYLMKYKILETSELTGIPQHRERIYIVCFKEKKDFDKFEFPNKHVELKPIRNYLENNINNSYYYKPNLKVYEEVAEQVTKHINTNTVYQYRRYYVRENKNNVCPTLTANMGSGGHNVPLIKDDKGIRKLTPRECFNLQGFPTNFKLPQISDSGLYHLAGNAISMPVGCLIAKEIRKLLI